MSSNVIETSSSIVIRTATASDLPGVLELNHHLHESEPVLDLTSDIEEIWLQMINDNRLFCFVAEASGNLIAACILDIVPNLTRASRPFGVLQNIVTHRDYRGCGVGKKLNSYALNFAWSKNCYQVLVQTGRPEVVAFYEKLGFRQEKIGLVAKPMHCT